MKKRGKRLLLVLLASILLLGGVQSAAAEKTEYAPVRVYLDGLLRARGYEKDGVVYLSAEELGAFLQLKLESEYDEKSMALTLTGPELTLQTEGDQDYVLVNGRLLYNPEDFFVRGGRSYFPVELLTRVFNVTVYLSEQNRRLDLELEGAAVIQGGDNYYDYYEQTYGTETLVWLSRIIQAEATNQPLAGKIGVGNVVLNRVASEKYPDTVMDVVFDTQNGVQFQPVLTRSIYKRAGEKAIIAACLCLEGYNTVGDSLFFVAPAIAELDWIQNTRTFVVRIGDHDFYM